jgi:hypothetical protein
MRGYLPGSGRYSQIFAADTKWIVRVRELSRKKTAFAGRSTVATVIRPWERTCPCRYSTEATVSASYSNETRGYSYLTPCAKLGWCKHCSHLYWATRPLPSTNLGWCKHCSHLYWAVRATRPLPSTKLRCCKHCSHLYWATRPLPSTKLGWCKHCSHLYWAEGHPAVNVH